MFHSHFSLVSVLVALLPASFGADITPRAGDFKVLSPLSGDTLTAGTDWEIQWANTTERNVTISVRKGPPQNTTLVRLLASNAPNNGTYAWRSNDDSWLEGSSSYKDITHRPISDCDYFIELRSAGQVVNSGYFEVINVEDGGLKANATCLSGSPPTTSGNGGDPIADGSKPSGITPAILGGALAAVTVGLVAIFVAIILIGQRKGWFVSKEYLYRKEYLARHDNTQLQQANVAGTVDEQQVHIGRDEDEDEEWKRPYPYQRVSQLPAPERHQLP